MKTMSELSPPPIVESDEGEPQMKFLLPAEGGAYERNPADGSLKRLAPAVAAEAPAAHAPASE